MKLESIYWKPKFWWHCNVIHRRSHSTYELFNSIKWKSVATKYIHLCSFGVFYFFLFFFLTLLNFLKKNSLSLLPCLELSYYNIFRNNTPDLRLAALHVRTSPVTVWTLLHLTRSLLNRFHYKLWHINNDSGPLCTRTEKRYLPLIASLPTVSLSLRKIKDFFPFLKLIPLMELRGKNETMESKSIFQACYVQHVFLWFKVGFLINFTSV